MAVGNRRHGGMEDADGDVRTPYYQRRRGATAYRLEVMEKNGAG